MRNSKKQTLTIFISIFALISSSCKIFKNNTTFDEGIVINGIKWATRNVDKPGTFAPNPESSGMFYQWNRKIGWSATDPLINSDGGTKWDSTNPKGTEWSIENAPCPAGWRLPTSKELKSLFAHEWTTQNGTNGIKCSDIATGKFIFLPAAGHRNIDKGELLSDRVYGAYWSSNESNRESYDYAHYISFNEKERKWLNGRREFGFCVRCVAK